MAHYTITRTELHSGFGTFADFRTSLAMSGTGDKFSFLCAPDGAFVRSVRKAARTQDGWRHYRKLSAANEAKRAPQLEEAVKAHLAGGGA